MTRPLLAILLLLSLITGCVESPSKPTASGGSSAGSEKVVAATPEEPYECDSDLILEPHLPEECIPPEPSEPVVQKPMEPPKPDPIIGTYLGYSTETARTRILRVYPDGTAGSGYSRNSLRWKKKGNVYSFYYVSPEGQMRDYPNFSSRYQEIVGEPELISFGSNQSMRLFEGLKKSNDPNHLFDHYRLSPVGSDRGSWRCVNVGRGEEMSGSLWEHEELPDYGDSLAECESLCLTSIQSWSPNSTCPQDRR
jgi:hypothetical protein